MQNDHSRITTCHVALVRNPRSYVIDNLDECQTVSAKAHVQYDASGIPHNINRNYPASPHCPDYLAPIK